MPTVPSGTQFVGIDADKDLTSKKSGPAATEAIGYTVEDIAAKVVEIQSTTTTTTAAPTTTTSTTTTTTIVA